MRVQRFLALAGVGSRRQCDALVLSGKVTVNDLAATPGLKIDPAHDLVKIDGIRVSAMPLTSQSEYLYFLLNKPPGFITTTRDPFGRPTIMNLLPRGTERVFPVGRLDKDVEGALLLTNDGDLANRIMHPRFHLPKTYEALVKGKVRRETARKLEEGIVLEEGKTLPAKVWIVKERERATLLKLEIAEGKKRQIKRMFAAIGHPVLHLKRTSIGPITLDALPRGKVRPLSRDEVLRLKKVGGSDA